MPLWFSDLVDRVYPDPNVVIRTAATRIEVVPSVAVPSVEVRTAEVRSVVPRNVALLIAALPSVVPRNVAAQNAVALSVALLIAALPNVALRDVVFQNVALRSAVIQNVATRDVPNVEIRSAALRVVLILALDAVRTVAAIRAVIQVATPAVAPALRPAPLALDARSAAFRAEFHALVPKLVRVVRSVARA